MNNDRISPRQGIYLVALFILGSSVIVGGANESRQDAWISTLLAAAAFVPFALVYARLSSLYPGKNVFEISAEVFGRVFGWIISCVLFLYFFILAALILNNFAEFVRIVSLPFTPVYVVYLAMGAVCALTVRYGIGVLGRASPLILFIVAGIVIITFLLLTSIMDVNNLLPVWEDSGRIVVGAASLLSFPFAETVLFLTVMGALKPGGSRYKMMLFGLLIGTLLLIAGVFRNLMSLGPNVYVESPYPSYIAVSLISIGDMLQRIESLIASNLALCVFTKLSICVYGASQGCAKLFGVSDYKKIVFPITLLMIIFAILVFKNTVEANLFQEIYWHYALPVQLGIPLIMWIGAEIRARVRPNPPEEDAAEI